MTATKLRKLELIVKPILESNWLARNDDFYLYSEVCAVLCPQNSEIPLSTALRCHKELGLPNYESVTRVRRKLQEKYPELESERARLHRMKEQKAYVDYAKGVECANAV